jgi:hypothetical protein
MVKREGKEEGRRKKRARRRLEPIHVNHEEMGPIVSGLVQESQVRLSLSFSLFKSRLYLNGLGSLYCYAPLACNAYSLAPLVRI